MYFSTISEHDLDEIYVKNLQIHTGFMNDYLHIDFDLTEEYINSIKNNRDISTTALNEEEINLIDKSLVYDLKKLSFVVSLKCCLMNYSQYGSNKRSFFFRNNEIGRNEIRKDIYNKIFKVSKNPRAIYYDEDSDFINNLF